METTTKIQLTNRFKSFLWRLGSYALVSLIAFVIDNLGLLDINPQIATVIALILGEVTKYLNTKPTA